MIQQLPFYAVTEIHTMHFALSNMNFYTVVFALPNLKQKLGTFSFGSRHSPFLFSISFQLGNM